MPDKDVLRLTDVFVDNKKVIFCKRMTNGTNLSAFPFQVSEAAGGLR